MTAAQSRCTYTHSVSELEEFDGDTWNCPYREHKNGLCLFHLPVPEKTDEMVREALLRTIRNRANLRVTEQSAEESVDEPSNTFLGSRFGNLHLSHELLDPGDNQPIDFRECAFEGTLRCSYLEARSPVWFSDAVVWGHVSFDEAIFQKEVRFDNVTFHRAVSFFDVRFNADAHFTRGTFESLVTFYAASFKGDGKFTDARFNNRAKFSRARFEGNAQFGRAIFRSRVRFNNTQFGSTVLFDDAILSYIASFNHATFTNRTRFDGTRFLSKTVFTDATFKKDVSFIGVQISDIVTFDDASFERSSTFSGALDGDLSLARTRVGGQLEMRDIENNEQQVVSLRESSVAEGSLECSTSSGTPVGYDLRHARVGHVDLTGTDRLDEPLFENVLFEETTFDGFEFADYINQLTETGWVIHDSPRASERSYWSELLVPSVFHTPFELAGSGLSAAERAAKFGTYESTYLRAKNGARQVGFSRAAADFFIRELAYRRRKSFWQVFADAPPSRIRAAYRWGANTLLGVISGYGERPSYVLFFSGAVVVGFGSLYSLLAPGLYSNQLSFLSLSIGSFVTLLFGNPGAISNFPVVSALAHLEGVVGAFLIAVFVFTLTRSLHR